MKVPDNHTWNYGLLSWIPISKGQLITVYPHSPTKIIIYKMRDINNGITASNLLLQALITSKDDGFRIPVLGIGSYCAIRVDMAEQNQEFKFNLRTSQGIDGRATVRVNFRVERPETVLFHDDALYALQLEIQREVQSIASRHTHNQLSSRMIEGAVQNLQLDFLGLQITHVFIPNPIEWPKEIMGQQSESILESSKFPSSGNSIKSEQIVDEEDSFGVDFDKEDAEEISIPGSALPPKPVSPIGIIDDLDESSIEPEENCKETHFTAYYPRQVAAKTEYGFYVYAHLLDALIESDIQAFSAELGGRIPKPNLATETACLKEGALLTVMIQSDKLKFNQVGAMQAWKAPFVRFDFKFSADESLIDEIVEGRIAILLGMIEIASIDFKLSVGAASPLAAVNALPVKPTLSLDASESVPPYQKIFVSYSRKDSLVAEQYRAAQTQLGNTIFMDVHTIRAGEDWEEALKRFVREADVFQLFWSEHSASSEHVRFEWDYALKQRCPETLCRQFIRPTYWQKPMPDVPAELNHLHFAYVEVQYTESKTSGSA